MNKIKNNRAIFTAIPTMIAGALCLVGGCVSQRTLQLSHEPNWEKFVGLASQLQWSQADQGSTFKKAQKALGLTAYNAMELDGKLVVAQRNRHRAKSWPTPRVMAADDQKLVCAGDVFHDGRAEYVLACGWFGPMGGMICVYDQTLRKIVDQRVDGSVVAVELYDLLHDGKLELVCWQDHHHGTDGWLRDVTIYQISKSGVLHEIWNDYVYAETQAGVVTKQEIRFRQISREPVLIETKTSESSREAASYLWNPVSERFERCDPSFKTPRREVTDTSAKTTPAPLNSCWNNSCQYPSIGLKTEKG